MFRKFLLVLVAIILSIYSVSAFAESADIAKIGSNAVVEEGTTVDSVAVVFGNLTVSGTVEGDAAVVGGNIEVGPTGKILGDTTVVFGNLIKLPGSEVGNDIVEVPVNSKVKTFSIMFPILTLFALGFFGLMIIALMVVIVVLIAHLFTGRIGSSSFYVQMNPWKSLLYGFVSSMMILPIMLLLLVSIVGIPLIPLFVVLIFVASIFAYTIMSQLVGLKFFQMIKKPNQHMIWEVLVGFVIITLFVLIPYVGWMIKTLVWMTGLGATVATKFGGKW